jgi:hypothetical protein
MVTIHEFEITASNEEAKDLVDVLNYGGECMEGSIFSVNSYGVNDMDVSIKYPEHDELVTYNLKDEHIDNLIRLIEEQL